MLKPKKNGEVTSSMYVTADEDRTHKVLELNELKIAVFRI